MSLYYVINSFNKKNIIFLYLFPWYQNHERFKSKFCRAFNSSNPSSVGNFSYDFSSSIPLLWRTFSSRPSLTNLLCWTFSVKPSSTNLLCHIFSSGPSSSDLLLWTFSGGPSFFVGHFPIDILRSLARLLRQIFSSPVNLLRWTLYVRSSLLDLLRHIFSSGPSPSDFLR